MPAYYDIRQIAEFTYSRRGNFELLSQKKQKLNSWVNSFAYLALKTKEVPTPNLLEPARSPQRRNQYINAVVEIRERVFHLVSFFVMCLSRY